MLLPTLLLACGTPAADPTVSTGTGSQAGTTSTAPAGLGDYAADLTASIDPDIATLVWVEWNQLQPADVWLEYSYDEGDWRSTPIYSVGEGPQRKLLLGVPANTDVTWRLVVQDGDVVVSSEDQVTTTGQLPSNLEEPSVLYDDPTGYEDGWLWTSLNVQNGGWSPGIYYAILLDRKGRIVWYRAMEDGRNGTQWCLYARVGLDGETLLYDSSTYWSDYDGGQGSHVYRIKIDGTIVETYDTPGMHHPFVELPGDVLVYGAIDERDGNNELLRQRNADGTFEDIWNCKDFERSIGVNMQGWWYCQSNTLFWDEATDTFLYSFYSSDSVMHIDHATGETLRYFGDLPGAYGFDPPDSQFWWQHGVQFTQEGHLLLTTKDEQRGHETIAREYEIDDDNRLLHQVWSYGEGLGRYADTAGEPNRLENGNTLINYGADARIVEVDADGNLLWEVDWNGTNKKFIGRMTLVTDLYAFE